MFVLYLVNSVRHTTDKSNTPPPGNPSLSYYREHLNYGGCLEVKENIIRTVPRCIVYDPCAQRYARKCKQSLNLHLVGFRLVFVSFCKGLLCILYVFMLSKLLLLGLFFQYRAKRLAGKSVSEMSYFVSSET